MKAGDGTGHDGTGDDVGEVMAALADPTRRAILDLIAEAGEATATAAARTLPVSRQAVVKHLAVLEQAGLVDSRRRGREVLFSVRPERLETTADRLRRTASEWDARLRAIRRIAEGEGRSILPSILACTFLLLPGCDDGASEGGGEPTYIEVAEAPTLVDDADLVQIWDLRTDAEDRIWVLSRHAPLVHVYGRDGGRIAAFGELGDGPEEFRTPSHLVEFGGSGMGVLDAGHSNIRAFAGDGTPLEVHGLAMEFRLPPAMRDVYFGDLGWTWAVEGGLLQDRYPPPPAGRPMQMQQAYDFWAGELVFSPGDGGEPRTVLTLADYSTFSPDEPPAPRPLSAGPLWDLCPGDEFVLHTGATSELVRVGLDGSVRRRDPVRLPLGPVNGDMLVDWMVSALSTQQPMPGDTPEALRERARAVAGMAEPHMEPTVPPTRLRCDLSGRVWIQLFDMDHDRRGYAREWVVVGAEGELLAHVTFPEGFHPIRFGTDRVVGIVRDEFDAETVGWVPLPAVS